jgi:hypothetical protein
MATKKAPTDAALLRKRTEECAYALWECEGRPSGRDLDHWLQAEVETAASADTGTMPSAETQSAAPNEARKKARSRER